MVQSNYTIGAKVLRVDHEVFGVEKKIICGILKQSAAKKGTETDNPIKSKF